MATTIGLQSELEGIWLATLRAERRDRIDSMIIGLAGLLSGAFMVMGLAHIYISLAGMR